MAIKVKGHEVFAFLKKHIRNVTSLNQQLGLFFTKLDVIQILMTCRWRHITVFHNIWINGLGINGVKRTGGHIESR